MPRRCSVCTHPDRENIDEALVGATVISTISAKYRNISEDALGRHKANHLPAKLIMAEKAKEVAQADTLHRKRPRDIRRRNLPMLEEAEIVVVRGDIVSLTDNWLDALDEQRRLGGEIDSVGVDGRVEVGVNTVARRRLENRSKAFQNRHRVESSRHWVNLPGADGHVEDLERIGSTLSESDSRILEAIEAFEGKYGRGSFRWDRASSKELFYSGPIEGFWPEPEELRRIRDYLVATRGVAA